MAIAAMALNYPPRVDIVTLSYRDRQWLPAYLDALARLRYPAEALRLLIVDNGSTDGAAEFLGPRLPSLPFRADLLFAGRNLGFAGGCNLGASAGDGTFILFLNPDTEIEPDALSILVGRALEAPRAGLVEAAQQPRELAKWRDPSGDTDWCSGAAMLARREAFTAVGMFDTFFFPIYCEDVDLSWRMWLAGWRCLYEPRARVRHEIPEDHGPRAQEAPLAIRFSFAMRLIYDRPRGVAGHFVRGIRYLCSSRTEAWTRRAVRDGFLTAFRGWRHLAERRRAAQIALRMSREQARFVFTEWNYGRWMT